jgi:hypothetical protein
MDINTKQAAKLNAMLPRRFRLVLPDDKPYFDQLDLSKATAAFYKKQSQQAIKNNIFFKSSLSLQKTDS